MIQGVHHLAIIVSNEECVMFYRKMGFDVFKRIERKYDTIVLMRGYGLRLELFVDPNHPSRPNLEPLGLRHLALKTDDIEKTVQMLGVEIDAIREDWLGEKYCFVADPDGNMIELHE